MNSGGDPPAFHPPEEEDAEEVEEAPEELTLRSKLVVKEDGSFGEQIEIGLFDFGVEIGEISEVILISEHEGRLVVAFPEQVWYRTAARRLLPAKCLIKPVLVSVTSGPRESVLRGEAITEEEVINMRIWVGILEPKFEEQIGFGEEADPVQMFGLAENPFLPLGQSLWEVVNDQFTFKSAESGGGGSKKEKPEERLRRLEEAMLSMQQSLERIASGSGGKPGESKGRKGEGESKDSWEEGAGVRRTRRQCCSVGIDGRCPCCPSEGDEQKGKPKRLEELPRKPKATVENPLGEDLGLVEGAGEEESSEEEGGQGSGESGMEKAIIHLAKIASHLIQRRRGRTLWRLC